MQYFPLNIRFLIYGCSVLFMVACLKDNNNYDYSIPEKIIIDGVQSEYTLTSGLDTLQIHAQASSNVSQAEFNYTWGIYETNVQGYAPQLDTIAKGPILNYPIQLNAKTWKLVLLVSNKKTGFTTIKESTLNIITPYTRGWYIAKSIGDSTDIDQFITPSSLQDVIPNTDIYSRVNGQKIEGKAKQITFFTSYKTDVLIPNTYANTRTLFLQSDKEIACIEVNNFKKYRDQTTLFYGTPAIGKVGSTFMGTAAYYIIKGGKLFSIYNMMANLGFFSAPKMINLYNDDYQLSDYFLVANTTNPLLFDEISSSFISMSMGYGTTMSAIKDQLYTQLPANQNNKIVVYMGYRYHLGTTVNGIAILADKTNPQNKILALLNQSGFNLLTTITPIVTTTKLYQANIYASNKGDENLLYFSTANTVYSYNLDNTTERIQFQPPNGEKVTFIKHHKFSIASDYMSIHNYIIIGTVKDGTYKIRFFNKVAGNLNSSPDFTIEGHGEPYDIIYLSPAVTENTYPCSY